MKKRGYLLCLGVFIAILFVFCTNGVKTQAQEVKNIVDVEVNACYATALDSNGDVWIWGRNDNGVFGKQDAADSFTPVKIAGINKVKQIAVFRCDAPRILALKEDGTLWIWGDGYEAPTQIKGLNSIKEMAAGAYHYAALKSDGTVWTYGRNNLGQLGNGIDEDSLSDQGPFQVKGLSGVKHVTAGFNFTAALKEDGTVWSWGDDTAAQLGDNDMSFTQHSAPVQVKNLADITQVSAGEDHTLALKKDGTVWTWGVNSLGQLGYEQQQIYVPQMVQGIQDAVQVSAGRYHSLVLRKEGTVYGFGYSELGTLGSLKGTMGNGDGFYKPIKLDFKNIVHIKGSQDNSIAFDQNNNLFVLGENTHGIINPDVLAPYRTFKADRITSIKKVLTFAHTSYSSGSRDGRVLLKEDGTVWSYGENYYGELGNGTLEADRNLKQVNISGVKDIYQGVWNVYALKEDGTVWVWGQNDTSSGISDKSQEKLLSPVKIEGVSDVKELYMPSESTIFAIKKDGTLWAWGMYVNGFFGQVPPDGNINDPIMNRETPVQIPEVSNVSSITHITQDSQTIVFVLSNDGRAWSARPYEGASKFQEVKELKGAKKIAASEGHYIALKSDGTVMACGNNEYGQLGDGTLENRQSPVAVKNITDVKEVYCTEYSTYAIKNDGTVWTWGSDIQDYEGDKFNTPIQVKELKNAKSIYIDKENVRVYALTNNGEVWTWFKSKPKQVQKIPAAHQVTALQTMSEFGPYIPMIVCNNGELWAIMSNGPAKIPMEGVTGFADYIIKTKNGDYVLSTSFYDSAISSQAVMDKVTPFKINLSGGTSENNPSDDSGENPVIVKDEDFTLLKEMTVKTDKDFTITLNLEPQSETVNSSNIFVLDEKNQKVEVNLLVNPANPKQIFVKHIQNYEAGKSYKLYVTKDVKAVGNKTIKRGKYIKFQCN